MKYLILLLFPILTIAQEIKLPLTAGSYYRSCELRNRTCVEINFPMTDIATQTIYTVTSGKALYIEALCLAYIGGGGGLTGPSQFQLRDNTSVKYEPSIENGGREHDCINFGKNPSVFNTNMNLNQTDGDISVSVWAIGYEE